LEERLYLPVSELHKLGADEERAAGPISKSGGLGKPGNGEANELQIFTDTVTGNAGSARHGFQRLRNSPTMRLS